MKIIPQQKHSLICTYELWGAIFLLKVWLYKKTINTFLKEITGCIKVSFLYLHIRQMYIIKGTQRSNREKMSILNYMPVKVETMSTKLYICFCKCISGIVVVVIVW